MAELGARTAALHTLAVIGTADMKELAERADLSVGELRKVLNLAANEKLVEEADERYSLTAAGDIMLRQEYPHSFGGLREDPEFARLAAAVRAVSVPLERCFHRWRRIDLGGRGITNDHTDPDYDALVIGKIARLFERITPVMEGLNAKHPRLGQYLLRLRRALSRAEAGAILFVEGKHCESVRRLWQQLNLDLDRVLTVDDAGITRPPAG